MLSRAKKEEQVAELKDKLGRATSVYVADYRGLDVPAVDQLRRRVRSEGGGEYEYRVAKNSVLRLASAGSAAEAIASHLDGPTAIALSYGEPVGLAKLLSEFAKENEVFEIKGGVVDGAPVDASQIAELATLPSLDGLRGKIIGLLEAPATKLVRLLVEPGAQLARAIHARGAQEESGS